MIEAAHDAADLAGAGFTVVIESQGWRFVVPAGATMLQAAEQAGIRLPSSCRNGTCRTCVCRLVSGTIRYLVEWPGLLPEEKAENLILPCVAQPLSDLVIASPAARK